MRKLALALILLTITLPADPAVAGTTSTPPTSDGVWLLPGDQVETRVGRPACSVRAEAGGLRTPALGCSGSSSGNADATVPLGIDEGDGHAALDAGSPGMLSIETRTSIQTPRGTAAAAWFTGAVADSFLVVHRLGDVTASSRTGGVLWTRPSMSFFADWGLTPAGRAPVVLLPPMINPYDTATDPLNAITLRSERAFGIGDLTGDGMDEIAVGHFAVTSVNDGTGEALAGSSAVTVLDGADGTTLWTRLYPGYVTQVLIREGTLVVGYVAGPPSGGVGGPGATTALDAFRFHLENGSLAATPAWSVSTGFAWARWFALEPAGPGRLAAAWSRATSGTGGQVMLLDLATGATEWTKSTSGFPRTLRYDGVRSQLVVHEQANPASPPRFTVYGLRVADGSTTTVVSADAAVLSSLEVANVDVLGSPEPEWVIGQVLQVTANTYTPSTIRVVNPDTGATRWSVTRGSRASKTPVPQSTSVVDTAFGPVLVVASVVIDYGTAPVRILTELTGYGASTGGDVRWTKEGDPLRGDDPVHPAFLVGRRVGLGDPVVLTTTTSVAIRAYDASDGGSWLRAATMYEPLAVAVAQVNADGTPDLVVGTEGGGIFALDGNELHDDPGILWSAATMGPVRALELTDVDGDGLGEVVAATTNGIEVLDLVTGKSRWALGYPTGYVFSVAVGDVSGDGLPDVVVPTHTLAAFSGTDGTPLWEFPPLRHEATALYFSNAVVTPNRGVAAEFIEHTFWRTPSTVNTLLAGPYVQRQFLTVLEGATGRPRWIRPTDSADRPTFMPRWRSVAPGPAGSAVFTYERQGQFPNLADAWRPGLYRHDAATGDEAWRGRAAGGVVHMGTVPRGDGALEFNLGGLLRAGPDGSWEVDVGPTSDVADADLGDAGGAFLTNWDGHVHVFPAGAPEVPGEPELLAERPGLTAGRLLATDLDGDGADEVVTHAFDWTGFTMVAATSGMLVIRFDSTPHGIDVLSVRSG